MKLVLLIVGIAVLVLGCGGDTGTQHIGKAQINSLSPAVAHRGQTDIDGRIFGANLDGMSSVSLGDGIDIQQANVVSANELSLLFSVSPDAAPGPRTLTIYAVEGTFTFEQAFTVDENRVPRAAFTVNPPAGFRSTVFAFNASNSQDPDGNISQYRWKFGDGKSATGKSITHKFDAAGAFDVQLTVTDDRGATSEAARFVDVSVSRPPLAQFTVSPADGNLSTDFHFDAGQSRDTDGNIVSFGWDFGDGGSATTKIASHRFTRSGTFSVKLTVTDNTRLASTAIRSVVVDPSDGGGGGGGGGGNGGGTCDANNFNTNFFSVISFSGNTIVADQSFRECPGLCGEVRRPGGSGIREFVGDILGINGSSIMINTGSLPESTRPQAGEQLNVVWRTCGS